MATVEADWCHLDVNLLSLISQRFDNDLDLIRFRSVCSTWRCSSISNHHRPNLVPFKIKHFEFHCPSSSYFLSKHSLLLIKPPPQQQNLRPWLIRITQNSCGETQLFHPLRPCEYPCPYDFPYVLDFNKFSHVVHLGTSFIMEEEPEPTESQLCMELLQERFEFHYLNLQDEAFKHAIEKKEMENKAMGIKVVAVTYHGKNPLALVTLNCACHPLLFHCRKECWTPIPCVSTYFLDICVFKDRFCAVNKIGRTVAFGPDYSVELLAEYVDGGDMKFLVESEGDQLLLVDIYDSHCFGFPGEDGLKLDVFRLDEKEKKWVKLASLGDRVLFLGNGCSFSASASDLSVVKGNCVIFSDDAFYDFDQMLCGMCVFHLDQCWVSPLSDYPEYSTSFWPPPEWIVKSCIHEKIKREEEKERGHGTDKTSGLLAKLGTMQI
ncbi:F-box protein SKIP23 [Medicago truncatula]|uniref:F-box protein SKIP23 n=1 Tax=Medicago truncatula TaxID=3880 RepID=UPI0002362359|nr:F-box protein SKIP23 [Medicago truncatula]